MREGIRTFVLETVKESLLLRTSELRIEDKDRNKGESIEFNY